MLNREQIDGFSRNGFVAPVRLLGSEEATDFCAYFDAVLADYLRRSLDQYSISRAHLRHGRVWDLLCDSRVVAAVTGLIGPDVVGIGAHFWCKLPGDGKTVAWHQDASYWDLEPRAVTVWLAIDQADRDNGAMRFIPGSHRLGQLATIPSDDDSVLPRAVAGADTLGPVAQPELAPGEASIHNDLLLHSSPRNTSPRRRCGRALRYTRSGVAPTEFFRASSVAVAGRPFNWPSLPRPTVD